MRKFTWSQPGSSALLLTRFLALAVVSVLAVSNFGSRTLGNRLREEAEEHLREAALRPTPWPIPALDSDSLAGLLNYSENVAMPAPSDKSPA